MNMTRMPHHGRFTLLAMLVGMAMAAAPAWAAPAEYQWSVPLPAEVSASSPAAPSANPGLPRGYLWIPPACTQVRAVVVGQHNMLEENILEHPEFRRAMADLGIAIIWITPALDGPFNPEKSGQRFNAMMKNLADTSGYHELEFAPVAPIGHSAAASYPWNFAAWAPQRTLCALSIHGDAPQTPIAGFGKPNASWGDRTIDGVPGLMVMGEYEWSDARLAPAVVYRLAHPKTPIAMLAEPGDGHFEACDDQVRYLAMFLRKCVEQRLPALAETPLDKPPTLTPVDPAKGWLVQRWFPRVGRYVPPGPFASFSGDKLDAFWAFDEEMARATHNYHAEMMTKLPQLVGFVQNGVSVTSGQGHSMSRLKFLPEEDGETFHLGTEFLSTVTSMGEGKDGPGQNNLVRWTGLPAGSPIGHATGGGPILIHRIEGPVEQIAPDTFRLSFYRGYTPRQEIWLCAMHPGDDKYKSAVQQASMPIPRNNAGAEQIITFPALPDQHPGAAAVTLAATSSAGLPVHYYVREGPAEIDGNTLKLLPLPVRAKLPLKVTVVAWQWGKPTEPKVKTAAMVEQSFSILPADK